MDVDIFAQGGYGGGGINLEGGTVTGALLLFGNPSQPLEAVPKQYVDGLFSHLSSTGFTSGILPVGRLPAFGGDFISDVGSNVIRLKDNGITSKAYPKVKVNSKGLITEGRNLSDSDLPSGISWEKVTGTKPNTLAGYGITDAVSITGGTIQGILKSSGIISDNRAIVNKEYVDSQSVSGGLKTGDIVRKASNITPDGMLRANGAKLLIEDYSDLYNVIGDKYSATAVAGSGQPWRQQYEINQKQTGDITGWSLYGTLPATFCHHQAIVTKNRVYVFSGHTGTSLTTVYTAPITDDGLIGTWTTGTALPAALSHSQAIITNNRLYVIGGQVNSTIQSTVYTAVINSDGTLGTWSTGPSLPIPVSYSHAVKTSSKVYLIGGSTTGGLTPNIYSALINTDGTITAWVLDSKLPEAFNNGQLIVIKNKVYILNSAKSVFYKYIYESVIDNNGNLGVWTVSENFPAGFQASNVYVSQKYVYVIGGYDGTNYLSSVYKCPINADGTLGEWSLGTSFPTSITRSQVIATKNRIYMIGGGTAASTYTANIYSAPIDGGLNDYSEYYKDAIDNYLEPGSGRPWQQQYQVNNQQTGDISGWAAGTALPISLGLSQAVITRNKVYIIGGRSGASIVSTVYAATINSDGTLGNWTLQTAFPTTIYGHWSIVIKNRLYVFGGDTGSAFLSTVYWTIINSDGSLGTWNTTTSLPIGINTFQVAITKNRVYILGGQSSGAHLSTTYSATINIDGTLGPWVTGSSLPGLLCNSQVVVTKNRVYLLGGHNGTTAQSAVYTATISSDGTIGTWVTGTSLPVALYSSQAIITKNRVYLISGYTGSAFTTTTYYAPINTDGTLGTWVASSSILTGCHFSSIITTSSKVYLLGGWTGGTTTLTNVQVANFTGGLNDYSQYYLGDDNNYVMPGCGRPWEQQYQINTEQSGDLTGWIIDTNLPVNSGRAISFVTKNRAYILGGWTAGDNTTTSNIYTAPINTNGTLGTWTLTTPYPISVSGASVILIKNKIYVIGGSTGSTAISSVYMTTINSDGTLGSWTTAASLPSAVSNSHVFITKNYLYVAGGWNGSAYLSSVYYCVINSDGSITNWMTGTSLPYIVGTGQCVTTKNRVYILGGHNGTSYLSAVYTAAINTDGSLGTWVASTPLPLTVHAHSVVLTKSTIYLIGGYTGVDPIRSTVYYAPINTDGTLGTWVAGTSMPSYFDNSSFIITSSRLYLLGNWYDASGVSGYVTNQVMSVPFTGGLNDYSPYYDGTIEPYGSIDMNDYFYLPDFTSSELEQSYSFIKI